MQAILLQELLEIGEDENINDMQKKFVDIGPEMLKRAIKLIVEGKAKRKSQKGMLYSYTPAMPTGDNMIDWNECSSLIHNKIRARQSPVWSYTYYQNKNIHKRNKITEGNSKLCWRNWASNRQMQRRSYCEKQETVEYW